MIIEYPDSELIGKRSSIDENTKQRLNDLFPNAMKGVSFSSDIVITLQKQDNLLQLLHAIGIQISPFLESILVNNKGFNQDKHVRMLAIIHTREYIEIQINIIKKSSNTTQWSIIYHLAIIREEPVVYIENNTVSYRLDRSKKECSSSEHTLSVSDLLTYLICRDQIIQGYKLAINNQKNLSNEEEKALIEKGLFSEFVSLYMIDNY